MHFRELVQGMPTESTSSGDRLHYGHSQCLISRTVVNNRHHGLDDRPGKWPGKWPFKSHAAHLRAQTNQAVATSTSISTQVLKHSLIQAMMLNRYRSTAWSVVKVFEPLLEWRDYWCWDNVSITNSQWIQYITVLGKKEYFKASVHVANVNEL